MEDSSSEDDPHEVPVPDEHWNPEADTKDAAYVRSKLHGRRLITDGTLSCPSCFTILCYWVLENKSMGT